MVYRYDVFEVMTESTPSPSTHGRTGEYVRVINKDDF